VHPDFIQKITMSKGIPGLAGNFSQRIPRVSKDIKQDTERYKLLSEIMQTIMIFLRANVS
jgi:hypothetical protein